VLATAIEGVNFAKSSAPFDLISLQKPVKFYEIKTSMARPINGRTPCNCYFSESEILFANVILEEYIVTIIWEGDRYDIPYVDIKDRLKNLAWSGGGKYGRWKRLSLARKFLKNYLVPKVKVKTKT
jgi:hypothetical protein